MKIKLLYDAKSGERGNLKASSKILSLGQTVNYPFLEWRGCLENDNYFIIRYDKGYLYYASAPRELTALLNLKGFKFAEYPEIETILEELGLEPPDGWMNLEK